MQKKIILILNILTTSLVHSMDEPMNIETLNICMLHIFPKRIQANPGGCSHDTICALALVSSTWNKIIKNTAVQRRRYFTSQQEYKDLHSAQKEIYQQQVWHTHNSAYAYWVKSYVGTQFYLNYLDGDDKINTSAFKDSSLTIASLPNYRPFFNAQGDVCYHAWQDETVTNKLIELSLSTTKSPKIRYCYLDVGNNQTEKPSPLYFVWVESVKVTDRKLNPGIMKEYPILLKAFMNSQHVEENDREKIYHLDGVTIDENYLLTGSFPSNWWRNAIAGNCIIKKNDTKTVT